MAARTGLRAELLKGLYKRLHDSSPFKTTGEEMSSRSITADKARKLSFKNRFYQPNIKHILKLCYLLIRHESSVGFSSCKIEKSEDFSPELIQQVMVILIADGFSVDETDSSIRVSWH